MLKILEERKRKRELKEEKMRKEAEEGI